MVNIYALYDPREPDEVRYIGKTVGSLRSRLRGHLKAAKLDVGRNHRLRWIRKLLVEGIQPQIRLLEQVDDADWQEAEMRLIKAYRDAGHPLTNTTEGGQGVRAGSLSEEHKEKLRMALRGRQKPPGHGEKIRQAHKGRPLSEEHKERIRRTKFGRRLSGDHKKKIGDTLRGRQLSEEHKVKLRQPRSQETRQKIADALRGKPSPTRGKTLSEEHKAKIAEAARRRWAARHKADRSDTDPA